MKVKVKIGSLGYDGKVYSKGEIVDLPKKVLEGLSDTDYEQVKEEKTKKKESKTEAKKTEKK